MLSVTSSLIPVLPSEEGGRQHRRQKSNHPAEEWRTAAPAETDRADKPEEDSFDLEEHKSSEIKSPEGETRLCQQQEENPL